MISKRSKDIKIYSLGAIQVQSQNENICLKMRNKFYFLLFSELSGFY